VAEPVSDLEILSFQQRFGSVAVSAEGIGGVETLPAFRNRGYMRKLLTKASAGMAERVDVGFVSEGITHLYEKFGFVSCLNEAHLVLKVRQLEPLLVKRSADSTNRHVRPYTLDDLPKMVTLYNGAHAQRPWTHIRHPSWNRLQPQAIWNPGSTAIIVEENEHLAGYAIFKGTSFGQPASSFTVDELTAKDANSAQRLLAELTAHCWDLRLSEFTVREPIDSLVGWEARRLGCEYRQVFPATGEMMGAILNRSRLLQTLEPELRRRVTYERLFDEHEMAFTALQAGELVPDNHALVRLLLGFWSAADAQLAGALSPSPHTPICTAWFPGGGSESLQTPYAHKLDRY